jgi:hypothetical protein
VPTTLEAEALRLNARYVEEVVVGWDLCPWAARAWRDGEVERVVFPQTRPEARAVAAFVEQISARPRCSIGLAIFPRVDLSVSAWDRFAEEVRRTGGPFLIAAFHPQPRGEPRAQPRAEPRAQPRAEPHAQPRGEPRAEPRAGRASPANAAELVSLIRRTPDPTLQLVRASLIDALAAGGRDVSGEIARANFATVTARDPARLAALLDDLRRDRDRAYAPFA